MDTTPQKKKDREVSDGAVLLTILILLAVWGIWALPDALNINITLRSLGNLSGVGNDAQTAVNGRLVRRELYTEPDYNTTDISYLPTPSAVSTTAAADALSGSIDSSTTGTASLTEPDSDTTSTMVLTSTGSITDVVVTPFIETSTYTDGSTTGKDACTGAAVVTVTIAVTVDPLSASATDTPLIQSTTSSDTSPSASSTSASATATEPSTVPVWTTSYNLSTTVPPILGTGTAVSASISGSWLTMPSHNSTYKAPTAVPHHTATSSGSDSGMSKTKKSGNGGSAVSYCIMMVVLYTVLGIF